MTVDLIYRAAPGPGKNRPEGFSKGDCLLSFLRARSSVTLETRLTFLVDGELPHDVLEVMGVHGEVVQLGGVGNSGSYLRALDLGLMGAPDDVVYFCEDDYLHTDASLKIFVEVCAAAPRGTYITLYDHPDRYRRLDDLRPTGRPVELVAGRHWSAVESSAMTFGAARRTLTADRLILGLAARYTRYPHDRAMWRSILGLGVRRPIRWVRRGDRRLLGAVPALATHMEQGNISPVVDWAAVRHGARGWAEAAGHSITSPW